MLVVGAPHAFLCVGVFVACKVGVLLEELPDVEAAALQEALVDPVFSAADIYRVLRGAGFQVGVTTVKSHRREDCVCVFG